MSQIGSCPLSRVKNQKIFEATNQILERQDIGYHFFPKISSAGRWSSRTIIPTARNKSSTQRLDEKTSEKTR